MQGKEASDVHYACVTGGEMAIPSAWLLDRLKNVLITEKSNV